MHTEKTASKLGFAEQEIMYRHNELGKGSYLEVFEALKPIDEGRELRRIFLGHVMALSIWSINSAGFAYTCHALRLERARFLGYGACIRREGVELASSVSVSFILGEALACDCFPLK